MIEYLSVVADASIRSELTGSVMEWAWVRGFTPLLNLYAVVFLVGGAAWSAVRYSRSGQPSHGRITGNWLIAIGALLPAVGGGVTRFGPPRSATSSN